MKFGIFYEHQLPRPWRAGRRAPAAQGRARAGRARRPARHRLRLGGRAPLPRGVLATRRRRRSSSPPLASARKRIRLGHGIVQLPPAASTTPRASPSASPTLDLVSDGRVEFGTGEASSRGRARRRSGSTARPSASSGTRRSTRSTRMFVEEPFAGWEGKHLRDAAAQRRAQAAPEAAPAAVGRVQPARDDPPRRARRASARSRFSFIEPAEAKAVGRRLLPDHRLAGVRPGRLRGEPEAGRRAADDVPRGRADGDRPRSRRRALLRILARRTTTSSATHRPGVTHVWDEFQEKRALFGFDREIAAQTGQPLGAQLMRAAGSARCAARSARPRRSRRCCAGYEAGRRRPGDLRVAGGPQPPRAHLRVARAVREAR